MSIFTRDAVLRSLLEVLAEGYEGPRDPRMTWFVENAADSGLFGTLRALSAGEASRAPGSGRRSVAAHAEHLRFSMDVLSRFIAGERVRPDWARSWAVETVDERGWEELRAALRGEYERLRRTVDEVRDWKELTLAAVAGALAHAAYHLGAVRQIALAVRGQDARAPAVEAGAG
ncbi:MAG TPA: DinB family protein [Longimicrobium sp.]|jgi:uncharacterized damage-inducible protein DinB